MDPLDSPHDFTTIGESISSCSAGNLTAEAFPNPTLPFVILPDETVSTEPFPTSGDTIACILTDFGQEEPEFSNPTTKECSDSSSQPTSGSRSKSRRSSSGTTVSPRKTKSSSHSSSEGEIILERIHGPLKHLSEEDILDQALSLRPLEDDDPPEGIDAEILHSTCGTNNLVYVIRYTDGLKVCLRVPATGLQDDKWSADEADHLQSTALCMKYISENTSLPMPELLAYDTTKDNCFEAPYTMLTHIEGRPLDQLWWERDGRMPLEERRQAMLRNLAACMAQLRHLPFPKAGRFYSDCSDSKPTICPDTPEISETRNDISSPKSPASSTDSDSFYASLRWRLADWAQTVETLCEKQEKFELLYYYRGLAKVSALLIDHLPLPEQTGVISDPKAQAPEQFFISPPDNDLQNILADDYGNITGFVDWDCIEALPSYLSWASQPIWLRSDWLEGYDWPVKSGRVHSPRQLARYRRQYAEYLAEVCDSVEEGATCFTEKSAVFQAVHEYMGTEHHAEMLYKIMELLVPRVDMFAHFLRVGLRWTEGEEQWMNAEIKALFSST